MEPSRRANRSGSPAGVFFALLVMVIPTLEVFGLYAPLGPLDARVLALAGIAIGCGGAALSLASRSTGRAWLLKTGWSVLVLIATLDSLLLLLLWAGRD